MRISAAAAYVINRLIVYTSAAVVVAMSLGPYIWLFISSISLERDLYQRPRTTWFPSEPTFDRIMALVTGGSAEPVTLSIGPSMMRAAREFYYSFWNSLTVASVSTAIAVVVGALAAYGYSRFNFGGRTILFGATMLTRMIPPVSLAIPLYMTISYLQLMDTRLALIVTYNLFLLPVAIWVMSNYFRSIPVELEDAARIDGCSNIQVFYLIIIPISIPVIATVAILSFLMAWDEFFFALIFTQSLASKTLPKAIAEFSTQFGGLDYGMVATGGALASLVPVIIALVLQRYIVSGLTSGAVKG